MEKKMNSNPWPGLASYDDPDVCGNRYKFCGRDNDVFDVARLIDDHYFVTLYGKSGIGKSSLLKAGVFPTIRKENYSPLILRPGLIEEDDCIQAILVAAIEKSIIEHGGRTESINVVEEEQNTSSIVYLWNYFARHRFYDKQGRIVFPVVVFDQFEEVFRKKYIREEMTVLLGQINYLIDETHSLNDCLVDGIEYTYDFNFRFVISIREDDLYLLEDIIDNQYLPSLKNVRYRLKSLTSDGAKDVILEPGGEIFKECDKEQIVNEITGAASGQGQDGYSTNVLSLVCNRLYEDSIAKNTPTITLEQVKSFLSGNPFEIFYEEATAPLSPREKHYIEDSLIDSTGRRNSVTESDFYKNVPGGAFLLQDGAHKILQKVSVSSDIEHPRIELIHDSFCAPLVILRDKWKRKRRNAFIALIGVTGLIIFVIALSTIITLHSQKWSMLRNQSAYVAQKASILGYEDSLLKRKLAIAILPKRMKHIEILQDRPYIPDAELLLRTACIKEKELNASVCNYFTFASDEKLCCTTGDSINIVDYKSDSLIRTIKTAGYATFLTVRNEGKSLFSSSIGDFDDNSRAYKASCVQLFNTDSGQLMDSWTIPYPIYFFSVSPDMQYIFLDSGEVLNTVSGQRDSLFSPFYFPPVFSPDGTKMATGGEDGILRIWDIKELSHGRKIHKEIYGHFDAISSIDFTPDGKSVVTASEDHSIRLWNIESGEEINHYTGHPEGVYSVSFNADGELLVSNSQDGKVLVHHVNDGSILLSFSDIERYRSFLNTKATDSLERTTLTSSGYRRLSRRIPSKEVFLKRTTELSRFLGISVRYYKESTNDMWLSIQRPLEIKFSPDGKSIIANRMNGRLFRIEYPLLQDLITETQLRLKDNSLSPEERKEFFIE